MIYFLFDLTIEDKACLLFHSLYHNKYVNKIMHKKTTF